MKGCVRIYQTFFFNSSFFSECTPDSKNLHAHANFEQKYSMSCEILVQAKCSRSTSTSRNVGILAVFFEANRFVTLKMDEMVLCDVKDVIGSDDPAENFYQFGFPLYLF